MDKSEIVINDILSLLKEFAIHDVPRNFLRPNIHADKYANFPDYYTICHLLDCCTSPNEYFLNVIKCFEEFKKYMREHSAVSTTYSMVDLNAILGNRNDYIARVFKIIGIPEQDAPRFSVDNVSTRSVNAFPAELFGPADQLVDLSILLVQRCKEFTQQHGLFNQDFRDRPYFASIKANTYRSKVFSLIDKVKNLLMKNFDDFLLCDSHDISLFMEAAMQSLMVLSQIDKKSIKKEGNYRNFSETVSIEGYLSAKLKEGYERFDQLVCRDHFTRYSYSELQTMYRQIFALRGEKGFAKYGLSLTNEAELELRSLVGLENVKETIIRIKSYCLAMKGNANLNLHMCFTGNPGTGKTEVARLLGKILYENKILPKAKFVEADRKTLVGEYVGETPAKTMRVFKSAIGGVLFIDEAYSLVPKDFPSDYGHEAVATLIKAMEDYRGKICVILAGYTNEMHDLLATNPGFKSRIQFHLQFKNFSRSELGDICSLIVEKRGLSISNEAKERVLMITDVLSKSPDFGNARDVRNIIEHSVISMAVRDPKCKKIEVEDVKTYESELDFKVADKKSDIELSAEEQLAALVGLEPVKKAIAKIKAYAKRNKDKGFGFNFSFTGNPGTGKTEVARILSSLLYDAGVLREKKFIETNPGGLISKFVGGTREKTTEIIRSSYGGVLFIDEAYGLYSESQSNSYGDEAVDTLIKEMEDKRGTFSVVIAGYKNNIDQLLQSNPGFSSRIQFHLDFPDYSDEELRKIALLMLSKQGYTIEEAALDKTIEIVSSMRGDPSFANARTLRNVLEQLILNQNLRVELQNSDSDSIAMEDVSEYLGASSVHSTSSNKAYIADIVGKAQEIEAKEIDFSYLESSSIAISGDEGEGTGFIVSKDGYCLTCSHCIGDKPEQQKARIIFNAGRKKITIRSSFKLIKRDEENDIALIKIDNEENEYDYLPLANRDYTYSPLREIVTAGYPFGGEQYSNISVTDGKVASVNYVDNRKVIFANMFGKPGSSGSPVLDKQSMKVIGVFFGGIKYGGEMIPCFTPIEFIYEL